MKNHHIKQLDAHYFSVLPIMCCRYVSQITGPLIQAALNPTDDAIADVLGAGCCFAPVCTYEASITTATPFGCRESHIPIAICLVRRSWTGGKKKKKTRTQDTL